MKIGVDPGKKSPAHVLVDEYDTPIIVSREPISNSRPVTVYLAKPHPRAKSSKISLITLSLYAGLHVGAYVEWGWTVQLVEEQDWRNGVMPGTGRLPKTVFHNRVFQYWPDRMKMVRKLAAEEKVTPEDAFDAYLIAVGGPKAKSKGFCYNA